ncbi:hypothetical protein BO71DRAFT_434647 [Aspergillus ellipticus CBS 707.79]|uniref:Uncharacterized protein n=1 Tax=Aspergillus ellipticus CBS 707.79 TaxID=1448320 RepID=A0A319CXM7_9EURO|nr:hypothetical protein BO71DRAFT_434647 [Aspergillus ellipticus CBS 707.79]
MWLELLLFCYGVYGQWLVIGNTSVFWPTSTDYFYGPTTGPQAPVVSCNAAWVEYDQRYWGLYSLGPTATITTPIPVETYSGGCWSTVHPETWSNPHPGPMTTLCDGVPRALGPLPDVTDYYPGTGPCTTLTNTSTTVSTLYRKPTPIPRCSLKNTQDCIPIWETYSSRSYSWEATRTATTEGDTGSPIPPSHCPSTFRPRTSDIYISFPSIYAWGMGHRAPQCGSYHHNTMISAHPSTISSVCNHRNGRHVRWGIANPFNFADFMPHQVGNYSLPLIPWEQYRGGAQCPSWDRSACTMIRDDYTPHLDLPEEVKDIDPLWMECERHWELPPVTLVPLQGSEVQAPTARPHRGACCADGGGDGGIRVRIGVEYLHTEYQTLVNILLSLKRC